MTAHADGSDVIKADYPGRAARIGGLAQQRADQDIGSSGLIHDAQSKAIVISPEAFETFRDAAATEVRAPFDHHARGLARYRVCTYVVGRLFCKWVRYDFLFEGCLRSVRPKYLTL